MSAAGSFNDFLVAAAEATVGWHEVPRGSNDAPFLIPWRAMVGAREPQPWCVIAGYAWSQASADQLHIENPHPRTTSSRRCWELIPARARLAVPVRGALVLFRHLDGKGNDTGRGHEAVVRRTLPGGNVETIDGNSNDDGGRDGYEVARLIWDWQRGRRGSLEVLGYADLSLLIEEAPPLVA